MDVTTEMVADMAEVLTTRMANMGEILRTWYYLGLFGKFVNSPPSVFPCLKIWQIEINGNTKEILGKGRKY